MDKGAEKRRQLLGQAENSEHLVSDRPHRVELDEEIEIASFIGLLADNRSENAHLTCPARRQKLDYPLTLEAQELTGRGPSTWHCSMIASRSVAGLPPTLCEDTAA